MVSAPGAEAHATPTRLAERWTAQDLALLRRAARDLALFKRRLFALITPGSAGEADAAAVNHYMGAVEFVAFALDATVGETLEAVRVAERGLAR